VSCNAYYAMQAQRRLGLPLVVTLQGELGMDAGGLFQRSAFARTLLRSVLISADAITACSEQTLAEAEGFYGAPLRSRARVVYNGIRLTEFDRVSPYPHPRPYVLAIGRHVPQKGFDVLLRAFAEVVRGGETSHDLLLAGDGDEHPNLERLCTELGLGERVRLLGKVDHAQALRLFVGCAFFVLPSRHEPLGIVNLEAMAAGKAVIACDVGGVSEVVHNCATGLLVPAGDPHALVEPIRRLCTDQALRDRLAAAGCARARRFDWSEIAEQYAAVYLTAWESRARGAVPATEASS
jgi:glycosyltransferase involved in cell wall biosynthesis